MAVPWLDTLILDIRYGLRTLKSSPGFTSVAILSLAIWISVIFAGRLIGFSTSRAKEAAPSPADSSLEELFQTTPGGAGATSNPVPKK